MRISDWSSDVCSSDLASSGDTSEYALNREFVGYGGLNIDLLEGRFHNRFGYGYTNTSRDNYNPARSRQQTFDSAGRNERLEYQGSLSITQGLTELLGIENDHSRFRRDSDPTSTSLKHRH